MSDSTPSGSRPAPLPGLPARGSETGRPLMALFDLLGRRWALTCLWSLRDGPRTFRQIQALDTRISPTSLNRRLAELRAAGLVSRAEGGYVTTALGAELLEVGEPLAAWARRWAAMIAAPDDHRGGDPA